MFDKEMMAALEADGEKLRQLTGEDHGPWSILTCPDCFGEGSLEEPEPQHDDPYRCRTIECKTCDGIGIIFE